MSLLKSFDCLQTPLDKYRFNVITFEPILSWRIRKPLKYLTSKGYKLVMGRVGSRQVYETTIHEKIEEQFLNF